MGLIGYYLDHVAPPPARKIEPSLSDLISMQPPPDLRNRLIVYITVYLNHLSFSEDFLPPCCKHLGTPCFFL